MNLQELVVPFILDDKNFNSGIEGSITKATAFGNILGNLATSAISGAFNLLGQGIQTVKGFLADTVNEASASQDALAQLDAVLKSTGGAAGVTAEQAQNLANSLQKVTKFSDEQILSGENMLLTFTSIGKEVFPRATETILDMSQALGQDLKSSAIQLGKALNDPVAGISALRRVGVQFSDEQEEMIKKMVESGDLMKAQTFILDELQKEFGGSAEAAGKTFGGQLEILKNKLSDIKERIGNALIPILSTLAGAFSKIIDSPAFQTAVDFVTGKLTELSTWISTNLPIWGEKFETWMTNIGKWWNEKAKPALENAKTFLDTTIPQAIDDSKKGWKLLTDYWDINVIPVGNELTRLWGNIKDILELVGIKVDGNKMGWNLLSVVLAPVLVQIKAATDFLNTLKKALDLVNDILEQAKKKWDVVTNSIWKMVSALLSLGTAMPWWLKPGSPTPLENGLRGIDNALGNLNSGNLPKFAQQLNVNVSNPNAPMSIDYNKLARVLSTEFAKAIG